MGDEREDQRLANIRADADGKEVFSRETVQFLLSIIDRHKANLLAALDRVVELERERDAALDKNLTGFLDQISLIIERPEAQQ